MEVWLTLVLEVERWASSPVRFIAMKKASEIHWQAGSMGSKTGLDTAKKGKTIPASPGKQNSDSLTVQHVAYSLYWDAKLTTGAN